LNGTVVSAAHSEHVRRVSERTRGPPRARFALHCLQCLGSFVNCLSLKNSCSPAVKIKSVPQSTHFNTRSENSMAGFPRQGTSLKPAELSLTLLPFPLPGLLDDLHNKGPGRREICGYTIYVPIVLNLHVFNRVMCGLRSFHQFAHELLTTPASAGMFSGFRICDASIAGVASRTNNRQLVCFLASFLTIPLAC